MFSRSENRTLKASCIKAFLQILVNNSSKAFPEKIMRLIEIASDEQSPELVLSSIMLLRHLGKQGLPILIKASQDKNILKASAALTALGEMDEPLAEKCLTDLSAIGTDDLILRESLAGAINTLNQRKGRR